MRNHCQMLGWGVLTCAGCLILELLGAIWGICRGLAEKLIGGAFFGRVAEAPTRLQTDPTHTPGGIASTLPHETASRPEPTGEVGEEVCETPRGSANMVRRGWSLRDQNFFQGFLESVESLDMFCKSKMVARGGWSVPDQRFFEESLKSTDEKILESTPKSAESIPKSADQGNESYNLALGSIGEVEQDPHHNLGLDSSVCQNHQNLHNRYKFDRNDFHFGFVPGQEEIDNFEFGGTIAFYGPPASSSCSSPMAINMYTQVGGDSSSSGETSPMAQNALVVPPDFRANPPPYDSDDSEGEEQNNFMQSIDPGNFLQNPGLPMQIAQRFSGQIVIPQLVLGADGGGHLQVLAITHWNPPAP